MLLYSNIDLIIYLCTNAPVLTFYQENFIILQNVKVIRSIPSSSSACFTNHILSHIIFVKVTALKLESKTVMYKRGMLVSETAKKDN